MTKFWTLWIWLALTTSCFAVPMNPAQGEPELADLNDIEQAAVPEYPKAYIRPLHNDLDKFYIKTNQDQASIQGLVLVKSRTSPTNLMRVYGVSFGRAFMWMLLLFLVLSGSAIVVPAMHRLFNRLYFAIVGSILGAWFILVPPIFMSRTLFPMEISYSLNESDKNDTWHLLNLNCLTWIIDLRDEEAVSLNELSLKLPKDDTIKWSIAFRDGTDASVEANHLETDHFEEINAETNLRELSRGRQVFVLKATHAAGFQRNFWKRSKHLFRLRYSLDKQQEIDFEPVFFRHQGRDYEFPQSLIHVSETLRTFSNNGWKLMRLPAIETDNDPEIIQLLAKIWTDLPFVDAEALSDKSPEFKVRMIQLVDYLTMERGLDKFLELCFAPSFQTAKECNHILSTANQLCGKPYIPEKLLECWRASK